MGLSFDKHKIKQLDGSNVDQMPVGGNCLITQKSEKALLRQPPCTQPLRDWRNSAWSRETGFTLLDPGLVTPTSHAQTQEVDNAESNGPKYTVIGSSLVITLQVALIKQLSVPLSPMLRGAVKPQLPSCV